MQRARYENKNTWLHFRLSIVAGMKESSMAERASKRIKAIVGTMRGIVNSGYATVKWRHDCCTNENGVGGDEKGEGCHWSRVRNAVQLREPPTCHISMRDRGTIFLYAISVQNNDTEIILNRR